MQAVKTDNVNILTIITQDYYFLNYCWFCTVTSYIIPSIFKNICLYMYTPFI